MIEDEAQELRVALAVRPDIEPHELVVTVASLTGKVLGTE